MQMYDNFEGVPSQKCSVWVGNIMTNDPLTSYLKCEMFVSWTGIGILY